ncbi:hypothetical protein RJ641_005910 [Dillenia turbinata]|uniref:Uncharacterized protein n=1 Tax=Dillenia turbinata TaxID=194707 RepID=A0AAN8V976_9MAGN
MRWKPAWNLILWIFFSVSVTANSLELHRSEIRVLNVGKELQKETLPLQSGSCYYQLKGLKPSTSYEVKISYPASIPASFSIQLKRGNLDSGLRMNRRLLNTEKLIFRAHDNGSYGNVDSWYVLVTVEPEGVVAIPNVKERQFVTYNIVCDELLFGIPHKAWLVAIAILLCLMLAFFIPSFLPSWLLRANRTLENLGLLQDLGIVNRETWLGLYSELKNISIWNYSC